MTIIPTRKCYPKYADTVKRTLNLLNLQNQSPTKVYSRKSYPKVKQRKYTHAQKSLPSRKSYLRTHENRPPRKSYQKQYQNHNLQNVYHSGFHLGLKVLGGRFTHAAKCLATPTFVDHTPYYMLVHHSRSSYIFHIIDSTHVMMSLLYEHFGGKMSILGGKVHPSPPPRLNPATP